MRGEGAGCHGREWTLVKPCGLRFQHANQRVLSAPALVTAWLLSLSLLECNFAFTEVDRIEQDKNA